ncbi:hypothetical protein AVEN_241425-1 [Araneus ventricosus]|uniref:Uncharacterized protein n=1 Tax=Araneus ventricosus TaxID=182803 RepID=A0A4Y2LHS7_ARAVE|nr:hypothetical protein AVEN_241425-1 [Araneus ventricosus]
MECMQDWPRYNATGIVDEPLSYMSPHQLPHYRGYSPANNRRCTLRSNQAKTKRHHPPALSVRVNSFPVSRLWQMSGHIGSCIIASSHERLMQQPPVYQGTVLNG